MSLISAIILPMLEKELAKATPELTALALTELKSIGNEVVKWAEEKLNMDINGDGLIGDNDGKSS